MTLIEVLIVIAILLAIGGLIVVNLMPVKEGADRDIQRNQFTHIANAMDLFKLNMKRYPTDQEGLAALTSKEAIENEEEAANWQGPYLKEPIVKDLWGRELVYHNPSETRGEGYYDIISWGPDGQEGTADDITNHDGATTAEGDELTSDTLSAPSNAAASGR